MPTNHSNVTRKTTDASNSTMVSNVQLAAACGLAVEDVVNVVHHEVVSVRQCLHLWARSQTPVVPVPFPRALPWLQRAPVQQVFRRCVKHDPGSVRCEDKGVVEFVGRPVADEQSSTCQGQRGACLVNTVP